jgi:hypothetical protein
MEEEEAVRLEASRIRRGARGVAGVLRSEGRRQ